MGKRTNDVSLEHSELEILVHNIELKFRQDFRSKQVFTGTKDLEIYGQLQGAIFMVSNTNLSLATLRDIMTLKHKGVFRLDVVTALQEYISSSRIDPSDSVTTGMQRVFWSVNQGEPPGLYIESLGNIIPWPELKLELETRAITQCPRIIPVGSKVRLAPFYGKKDWLIRIVFEDEVVGSVWIGGNPYDNWAHDGFVRVGKTLSDTKWVVYQVLARFPDGSYKVIKSFV